MPLPFVFLLVLHVLAGVAAVLASGAAWLEILSARPRPHRLTAFAWTALEGYLISWLAGGLYYVRYYGPAVKPLIKAGPYPLAHAIGMELKEHVFLFLPFLALALCAALWMWSPLREKEWKSARGTIALLAGVSASLGALVALLGIVVSGAVR